jgi:peptidoglycan hydrolase-like protein with peptidoglycan-binding domain
MRRRNLVVLLVFAVVLACVTTWVGAAQIRSPAEVAARTAPPTPSPIVVPVVEQVLTTKVVTRGTAHYGSPRELGVVRSALKSGPRVITTLPEPGSVVAPGDILLTISGRPVFLFDGLQPAHRDLGPGMSGEDVMQLERGLKSAGFDPGAVDGRYDNATGRAVASLYGRHGVEPVVATEAQLARARPLEADLVAGTRAGSGVQLPADEVVFVPSTPVRVSELPVGVGAPPDGALVKITGSQVVIGGALPVEQAGLVKAGSEVIIDEPALGISTSGRVAGVADRPGTDGADGFHVAFEVAVDNPPPTLVGASVRLTVPINSTREAGLTVPVSAVSMGPDGRPRVQKSVDGRFEFLAVKTGLSADGYVSVTVSKGDLAAGDLVVVGFDADQRTRG